MYLGFFQLQREPFQVTPDPAFFYSFPGHREALAALIYGVEQRKGMIALTGEVGVGKTTILRVFLEGIDRTKTKVIYLLNANVAFDDLVNMLLHEFDADAPGAPTPGVNSNSESPGASPSDRLGRHAETTNKPNSVKTIAPPLLGEEGVVSANMFQRVSQLHLILIELFRQDWNVVLIIDEAQNMPVETLESLRTLSNLETATDKLLQIVFCGQPELDEKLARPELRQLKQRIAVRATVRPLTYREGARYVQHRLSVAGVPQRAIFTKRVIRQILHEAQGIPRLINILCDNALVTAFGYQARQVKGRVAKEIIADHKAQAHPRPVRWFLPAVGLAAAALVALTSLNGSIGFGQMQTVPPIQSEPPRILQVPSVEADAVGPTQTALAVLSDTATGDEAQTTPAQPVTAKSGEQEQDPVKRVKPVAAAYEGILTAAVQSVTTKVGEQQWERVKGVEPDAADFDVTVAAAQPVAAKVGEQDQERVKGVERDTADSDEIETAAAKPVAVKVGEELPVVKVVKPGDRLLDLVEEVYGAQDNRFVKMVKQLNPQIIDSNLIRVGDRLVFPPNGRQE